MHNAQKEARPSLEGTLKSVFWYPDFRVILPAAAFPSLSGTVTMLAAFVTGYSGGAVLDSHQLPSPRVFGDKGDARAVCRYNQEKFSLGSKKIADLPMGMEF